ncbi:hypothetical protein GA0070560_101177 [Micromonospora halophytica]|uniref:Uncharacterized protein n=1 Tax=Micromonospora halophytica TaxID=47864 RepID=A0A1C5GJU5_9ACTN|nr:hypothetical protein GA0070560_101177 [Micromonospora halophytica]
MAGPEALHPNGGEVADPPIRNRSGYPEAVEFLRERALMARLLRRSTPSPRQRTGQAHHQLRVAGGAGDQGGVHLVAAVRPGRRLGR